MCNLYSHINSPDWTRRAFRVEHTRDFTGNMPPKYAIFPDGEAPVVRVAPDGEREMTMMRWGMPGPVKFGEKACTNIRNSAAFIGAAG